MNILHWKRTTIAEAPDELSKCINKYSNHSSNVVRSSSIRRRSPDILHFHNKTTGCPNANSSIIQYHSEPHRVNTGANVNKKLVVAQYHATLPEYKDCLPVKNIIDFRKGLYDTNRVTDKIRVGFSPSATTNNGYWYNKGYRQTKRVLMRLKKSFPEKFDFDIISGVELDECIKRKSKCNIIIDECVAPSYHRSGLEGLALGKLTVCSLSSEVENVLIEASEAEESPFYDVKIIKLYSFLKETINKGLGFVLEEGRKSREWMENNWSPEQIVDEYINIYEKV